MGCRLWWNSTWWIVCISEFYSSYMISATCSMCGLDVTSSSHVQYRDEMVFVALVWYTVLSFAISIAVQQLGGPTVWPCQQRIHFCQKTRSVIRGSRRKGRRKRGSVLACGAARRYFILTSYGVTLFILTSYVIWLVARLCRFSSYSIRTSLS